MAYDKKKYEELINASKLFEIDKESQSAVYRKESLKMVEYLYCYLLAVNESKYEQYGCEIVDVATRCINGFDGSSDFLHYFNAAWKNEYSHLCGNEIIDGKFKGLKLSEQERRDVKKYMRLIGRCNPELTNQKKYEKIAELMDISVETVIAIANTSETVVVGEYTSNADGEEVGAFDLLSDDFLIESYFESLASLSDMLDEIEKHFNSLQERQKPIVADMITCKIGDEIFEIEKLSKQYSFISDEVRGQIKSTGKIPTQREIADKYGKNEASISRTIKDFLKRVKEGE